MQATLDLTPESIAVALQSGDTPIQLYSFAETLEFLDGYILDNPYESVLEASQYAQLKALLLGDFVEIYSVKVCEVDSGEMKFYLFGRTADGYLVGLQTVLIET